MSQKRGRESCHFVSDSLWRHEQGRHTLTFFCSSLVKSETTWLRLEFRLEEKEERDRDRRRRTTTTTREREEEEEQQQHTTTTIAQILKEQP